MEAHHTPLNTNRALWDAQVPIHAASDFYQVEAFKSGDFEPLRRIELAAIGDAVAGRRLLHLQCHFGQDTLSWARRGATVTGLDFSSAAIALARQLSAELALPSTFVEGDVLRLREYIHDTYDWVYTSYGVLCWLSDLTAWASGVAASLVPGGRFYMAEFHPMLMMYDFGVGELSWPYFKQPTGQYAPVQGSYADADSDFESEEVTWAYSMSEVVMALQRAGLRLLDFQEFDYSPWDCFPDMQERAPQEYVFRAAPLHFPHTFSLLMERPAV